MTGALQDAADTRAQINHDSTILEVFAILRFQDRAATRREYDVRLPRQVSDHFGFALTKAGLAFDFKDQRDRGAGTRLDLMVRIDETFVEFFGQGAADGSLAGAHEAYQEDIWLHKHALIINQYAHNLMNLPLLRCLKIKADRHSSLRS